MTTSSASLRTQPRLLTRSHTDSGFWTMPNVAVDTGSRRISGRAAGAAARSFIRSLPLSVSRSDLLGRHRLLDRVGEEHRMDPLLERRDRARARIGRQAVELGLDLSGMRRQEQDSAA